MSMATTTTAEEARQLAAARVNLCLGYERRLLALNAQQRRLPVTIVTGFLGAGKTSLLRHVLANRLNLRVACAVSDLAALNVDELLVADAEGSDGPGSRRKNLVFEYQAPRSDGGVYGVAGADASRAVAAFRDVVWQLLSDDAGTEAIDDVDYLVMETSGTMDPTALVAAVQERFGKMTRARLDSVVTVVDGDALAASDADADGALHGVALRQLACADVVLLNKVDLMDAAAVAHARRLLAAHAPLARVYETDHARVYLPHVLDVAPPEELFTGSVSHESVQAQWRTGMSAALAASAVVADSKLRVARPVDLSARSAASPPPPSSLFSSASFEQATPTPLAALHAWLRHSATVAGMLRAKGVVFLAEAPARRFVVQLSGRQRVEVEDAGPWRSTPRTQFAVIGAAGAGFDQDQALADLERWLSASVGAVAAVETERAREQCLAALAQDERFEVVACDEGSVRFRLTCPASSLDAAMLRHHHHVDMDELTQRLVREVNASGLGALLVATSADRTALDRPDASDAPAAVAIASVVGPATVMDTWDELSARADAMLLEVRRKLAGCMCGF